MNGSFTAFDVDFEQTQAAPTGERRHTVASPLDGGAKDKLVTAFGTTPADPITRPPHVLRRTPRLDQNHRESWVTFSSTGSSVFASALNGSYPTPSRTVQEAGVDNGSRSAERPSSDQQQPHGRQLLSRLTDHGRNVPSCHRTLARRHSANLQCLDGWRALSLSTEYHQGPHVLPQALGTSTLSTYGKSCRTVSVTAWY